MARLATILSALVTVFPVFSTAHAIAVLDLRTTACHEQVQCAFTLSGDIPDGTVANLSAPQVAFGSDDFFGFSNGMIFGSGVFPHAFELSFNQDLFWTGGALELNHGFAGFEIAGSSFDATRVLADAGPGIFSFADAVFFEAGETYRFSAETTQSFGFGVLGELQFAGLVEEASPSVVPIPASLPLMLSILAGLIFFSGRGTGGRMSVPKPS